MAHRHVHQLGPTHAPRVFKEQQTRSNPVVGAMLKGLHWRELQHFGQATGMSSQAGDDELLGHLESVETAAGPTTHTARQEREKLAMKYSRLSDMFVDGVLDDVVVGVQKISSLTADERQTIVSSFIGEVIKPYEKWLTSSKKRVQNNGFGDPRRSAAYNRELEKQIKQRINQVRGAILVKYEKLLRRLDRRGIFSQETNRLRADAMLRVELRRRLDIETIRRDLMRQLDEHGVDEAATAIRPQWEEKLDTTINRHRILTESTRRRSIVADEDTVAAFRDRRFHSTGLKRSVPPHVRFAANGGSSGSGGGEDENGDSGDSGPRRSPSPSDDYEKDKHARGAYAFVRDMSGDTDDDQPLAVVRVRERHVNEHADADENEGEEGVEHVVFERSGPGNRRRSDDDGAGAGMDHSTSAVSESSNKSSHSAQSAASAKSLDRWTSVARTIGLGGADGAGGRPGMRRWKSVAVVRHGRGRGGRGGLALHHQDSIASIISRMSEATSVDDVDRDDDGDADADGDADGDGGARKRQANQGRPRPPSDLWGTFGYRPFVAGKWQGAGCAAEPIPSEVIEAEAALDAVEAKELELEEKVEVMKARMRDRRLKLSVGVVVGGGGDDDKDKSAGHTRADSAKRKPKAVGGAAAAAGVDADADADADEDAKKNQRHRYIPGRGDVDDLVAEYPPLPEVEQIIAERNKVKDSSTISATAADSARDHARVRVRAAADIEPEPVVHGMRSQAVRISSHSGDLAPGRHHGFGLGPLPPPDIPIDVRLAQDLVETPTNVLEGSVAWNAESMKFRRPGRGRHRVQRRELLTAERVQQLYDSMLAGVVAVPLDPIPDPELEGLVAPRKDFVKQLKESEPEVAVDDVIKHGCEEEESESTPALAGFMEFTRQRYAVASFEAVAPRKGKTTAGSDPEDRGVSFSLHRGLLSGIALSLADLSGGGGSSQRHGLAQGQVIRMQPWSSSSMVRLAHCEPWKHIAPQFSRAPAVTIDPEGQGSAHGVSVRPLVEHEISPRKHRHPTLQETMSLRGAFKLGFIDSPSMTSSASRGSSSERERPGAKPRWRHTPSNKSLLGKYVSQKL